MKNWNAYIEIKANGKLKDMPWGEMKKWEGVEKVWSKQGEWDGLMMLSSSMSGSMDEVEQFVASNLRGKPWVSDTRTWWAKSM